MPARVAADISAEERLAYLVRQFSRWRGKSSTLSFVADHQISRSAEQERAQSSPRQPTRCGATQEPGTRPIVPGQSSLNFLPVSRRPFQSDVYANATNA